MKLSVSQAAWLVGRSEKTIRSKLRSGELSATPAGPRAENGKTGPSFWLIDIEDLKKLPGVNLNPARLVLLAQKQGEPLSSDSLQARVEALESVFEEMEHEVVRLRQRVQVLEKKLSQERSQQFSYPIKKPGY